MKTLKNKIAALGMVAVGLGVLLLDGDATVLVALSLFGTMLFIEKEDCFEG